VVELVTIPMVLELGPIGASNSMIPNPSASMRTSLPVNLVKSGDDGIELAWLKFCVVHLLGLLLKVNTVFKPKEWAAPRRTSGLSAALAGGEYPAYCCA